jgi:thiamine kinase-like enzyme
MPDARYLLSTASEIDTAWVAGVLEVDRRSVTRVEVTASWDTPVSTVARVRVDYARETSLPVSFFVKFTKESVAATIRSSFEREVRIYADRAYRVPAGLMPACHYAAYSPDEQRFTIVLEDLSESHFQTEWPLLPVMKDCRLAVECIARLHAHWWDHPELEAKTHPFPDGDELADLLEASRRKTSEFVAFMDDRLDPSYRRIIDEVLSNGERLAERRLQGRNLTLVHNDAHLWNFLFPKKEEASIKLIDWQLFGNGWGATDLGYMIALFWPTVRRRRYESELLGAYHATLTENGVSNYSFAELMADYKLAIASTIFVPINQWQLKIWPAIWVGHLDRIFAAYEDLDCSAVLRHGVQ